MLRMFNINLLYLCGKNASLLAKGLENESKRVQIPTESAILLKRSLVMMQLSIAC